MAQKSSFFLRLAGIILGLTLLASLIVIVIGLICRWSQPVQFSNGFFIAGVIAILLGTLSVAGGFEQRASFAITYTETAGQASIPERTQRIMADINQRYGILILLAAAGILLIGISVAIGMLL
jgi:hypothetical protein